MFYKRMIGFIIVLVLIVGIAGCNETEEIQHTSRYQNVNESEDIKLSLADFFFYPKTELIWVKLQYKDDKTYYYKEPFLLERLIEDEWFEVAPKEGILLKDRTIKLEGEKDSVGILLYNLYGELPEGLYRFIILMGEAEKEQTEQWYPMSIEFTIQ